MQDQGAKNVVIRVDGYTRFCLTAICVLLTVLVLGLWVVTPSATPTARGADDSAAAPPGGVFNAGAQRVAAVDAANVTNQKLDATNQKLDRIISLLESGQAKVTVQQGEKANGDK